jgi:hypothetical protein
MNNEFECIQLSEIRNSIIKFNNDVTTQLLKAYYNEKSYSEILGVSRKELSHSNFICWILNPDESHGLSDFGLKRFFEILITSKFWFERDQSELFDNILTGNYKLQSVSTLREHPIGEMGRIDILVELEIVTDCTNRVRLVIENKVLSSEGKDQTNRYYNYFENINDDYLNIYVYLTAISSLDLEELSSPECENSHFIQINYQSLVDNLFEPALKQNISSVAAFYINQYIQSLSQPSFDNEGSDFERGLIMAIGTEERKLLEKFWTGNQKIILAALYAISSDPNQDKDVRDSVKEALSTITTSGRDRGLIIIKYNGKEYARIQKADIGYKTVLLLQEYNLIDENILSWMKEDTSCGYKLIKQKEEVIPNEVKYSRYRINNEPELVIDTIGYYIARNWGVNNIDKLINQIKQKFPQIEYIVEKSAQ